jgi:triosephosphate isomerase
MYKTGAQARDFFKDLISLAAPFKTDREVLFAAPFTCLEAAAAAAAGTPVLIAAQDLFWEDEGAYTGEVSAPMIKAAGAGAVIIGHSERRQLFGDCGEWINRKLGAALKAGLKPIVCIGETLSEREGGRTFDVLGQQLGEALAGFAAAALGSVVLAYEPVWAIGTGLTASPDQAQEVHAFIRGRLAERFDAARAEEFRLLYGGSVKPDNVARLMAQPDIDGALVGGASLEAASFVKIINFDA